MNEHQNNLRDLRGYLTLGFLLILQVAEALPVSVRMAPTGREYHYPELAASQVERLRWIVLTDQPLEPEVINLIEGLLLDWISMASLVVTERDYGPTPFLLRTAARISVRISDAGDEIAKALGVPRF